MTEQEKSILSALVRSIRQLIQAVEALSDKDQGVYIRREEIPDGPDEGDRFAAGF